MNKILSFDKWLEQELQKPTQDDYNPDGNSSRAVMSRSYFQQVCWYIKKTPDMLAAIVDLWDDWDTPILFFVLILLFPLVVVISPFWGASVRRTSARNHYLIEYRGYKKQMND